MFWRETDASSQGRHSQSTTSVDKSRSLKFATSSRDTPAPASHRYTHSTSVIFQLAPRDARLSICLFRQKTSGSRGSSGSRRRERHGSMLWSNRRVCYQEVPILRPRRSDPFHLVTLRCPNAPTQTLKIISVLRGKNQKPSSNGQSHLFPRFVNPPPAYQSRPVFRGQSNCRTDTSHKSAIGVSHASVQSPWNQAGRTFFHGSSSKLSG